MSLVGLLVFVLIMAVCCYIINSFVADARMKKILYLVLLVVAIIYLLSAFGVLSGVAVT